MFLTVRETTNEIQELQSMLLKQDYMISFQIDTISASHKDVHLDTPTKVNNQRDTNSCILGRR